MCVVVNVGYNYVYVVNVVNVVNVVKQHLHRLKRFFIQQNDALLLALLSMVKQWFFKSNFKFRRHKSRRPGPSGTGR